MIILVFKTSLNDERQVKMVAGTLNNHPQVIRWILDLDDWERILRVEVKDKASQYGIAQCIRLLGFDCEVLDH